jgi:hypothetical protein
MWTIIKANFLTNRSVSIWLGVLFAMMFFMAFVLDRLFVLPNVYFAWVIAATFLQTDDKHQIESLYCSLPIKRSRIVLTRYVSVFISISLPVLLSLSIIALIRLIPMEGIQIEGLPIGLRDILGVYLPVLIFFAVTLPFYFRFGYLKGILMASVSLLISSLVLSWLFNSIIGGDKIIQGGKEIYTDLLSTRIVDVLASGIIKAAAYIGIHNFLTAVSLLTLLLLTASYGISLKIYAAKEI